MLDIQKDLKDFSKRLYVLCVLGNSDIFADSIINSVVEQLVNETCTRSISHPIQLDHIQLLTIQRFLSDYNFHIEYEGTKCGRYWYAIVPNWRK